MPRERLRKNQRLPKYVYLSKGRYVWRPYLGSKKGRAQFGKEVVLCPGDSSMAMVWDAYDKASASKGDTLRWLIELYLAGDYFREQVAPYTQELYQQYGRQLINHELEAGGTVFGDVKLEKITKKVVRRYLDTAKAKVAANRRIQFLKAVYSWAVERVDGIHENPCAGVRLNSEKSRERYVEDWEYEHVLKTAEESSYPYIALMMELAYLTRQRVSEVRDRRVSEVTDAYLVTRRGKGSDGEHTLWSPRLRAVVDACMEYNRKAPTPINPAERFLIHDKAGKPIKKNAFDTAWKRVFAKAQTTAPEGKKLEHFTFHDLKAKGVSDHIANESGHRSEKMKRVYIRKAKIVESTA